YSRPGAYPIWEMHRQAGTVAFDPEPTLSPHTTSTAYVLVITWGLCNEEAGRASDDTRAHPGRDCLCDPRLLCNRSPSGASTIGHVGFAGALFWSRGLSPALPAWPRGSRLFPGAVSSLHRRPTCLIYLSRQRSYW